MATDVPNPLRGSRPPVNGPGNRSAPGQQYAGAAPQPGTASLPAYIVVDVAGGTAPTTTIEVRSLSRPAALSNQQQHRNSNRLDDAHEPAASAAAKPAGRATQLYEQLTTESKLYTVGDVVVRFNYRPFIEQLLIHALQPFTIPYVVLRFGCAGARNMALLPPMSIVALAVQLMAAAMLAFPVTLALWPQLHVDWPAMLYIWAVSFAYSLTRTVMIALKYALVPTPVYEAFTAGAKAAAELVGNEMLITGWLFPTQQLFVRELQIAALQNNIVLEAQTFRVRPSLMPMLRKLFDAAKLDPTLTQEFAEDSDGFGIPLLTVATALCCVSRDRVPRWLSAFAGLLAVAHCAHADTWVAWINYENRDAAGWAAGIVLAVLSMNLAFQAWLLITFFFAGNADIYRRYRSLLELRKLISSRVVKEASSFQRVSPVIDMLTPANSPVWCHCRTLLSAIGRRYYVCSVLLLAQCLDFRLITWLLYQYRIQTYFTCVTAAMLSLMVMVVSANLNDPTSTSMVLKMLTQLTLAFFLILVVNTLIYMLYGALANRETFIQLQMCADTSLSIAALLSDGTLAEHMTASLEAAGAAVEAAENAVKRRDEHQPFGILGFRSEFALLQGFAGLIISIGTIAVNYFPSPFS